jgi:PAS domain S-box-containing protein
LRILIVDDDGDDVLLLKSYIRKGLLPSSVEVDDAGSVAAGLGRLQDGRYDLVFVDYRLGAADGLTLLKEAQASGVDVATVLMTGQGDERVAVEAMKAGATDYLVKSWLSPDALVTAIRHAVALHETERRRRDAEKALRESEARYRLLFERNLAGIFRAAGDGRILEANTAFARMLAGGARPEVVGRPVTDFFLDSEEGRRLLACLRPGRTWANLETRFRRLDGTPIWVLLNVADVEDGGTAALEGQVIDITERKRDERAELEAAVRAVARLANAAAHEINNPLMAISGHLELLASKLGGDSPGTDYVTRARAEVERIAAVLARMMQITRLEVAEVAPGTPEMLDLGACGEPPPQPGRST